MGIFLFYTHDFPFPTFTAYALSIIFFLYSIVFALLTASLATGSGPYSSFQAAPMGIVLIAFIIIAFYILHRVRRPYQEANRPRSMMTFSALCPVSLINSLMFIIRIPSSGEGNLQSDFSGLPNPGIAAYAAMVISCLATFVVFLGFYVVYQELPPIKLRKDTPPAPRPQENTFGPSMSTNSYYTPSFKNPGPSGTAEKQRPLQTTYDHWTEIPV
ncbi:hypothetical protein Hypma_008844 [Hypsizygus marmoreus]|uniref:MARVEL domain-containing protein n=1 Tax=Hypsizygus marmoreus TaxID=39966 RepID=A0A369JPK7_HYPMA|nr:hypothetical protein Hypma_008844 [Hypsizygus marmoreus]